MPEPTAPVPLDMTHEEAVRTLAPERYLLDEMSDQERDRFEAHYFGCTACGQDLRMAELVRQDAHSGALAAPARGAAVIRPARWSRLGSSVVLPWAVAASLAVVVGYQSLSTGTTPAEALSPVVLRGATRAGSVPAVTIASGQDLVTLSADTIVEPATRQLNFALLGPAGDALLSGRAPVPPPGVPFLLLVRADSLAGSGRHTLVVRDADRPEVVAGEYAFDVSR